MKYINALAAQGQFRIFAHQIKEPKHKVGFLADYHIHRQINLAAKDFYFEHYHIELGTKDIALVGPSAGLAFYMLFDSLTNDYTIPDKYVFTGIINDDLSLQFPGDMQDKIPYLIPGDFLAIGAQCKMQGGVLGLDNHFLMGDLDEMREYFRGLK